MMGDNSAVVLWNSPNGIVIPQNEQRDVVAVIEHALALKTTERKKVADAMEKDLYDMATEYVWKRTINRLKSHILKFGIDFVLEMLGRSSKGVNNPEDELSESDIISLAADLGFIDRTARLLLLQQSELINHFASPDAESEFSYPMALSAITYCTQYVLAYNVDTAIEFTRFRERLYEDILSAEDELLIQLDTAPYFYRRTAVRTMLNLIKVKEGGELDNSLHNFTVVIPRLWSRLIAEDKWPVGNAYAEAVNDGHKKIASHIKAALTRVKGFDFVPENLRSMTFIEAARELLKVHFAFYNFYNEPDAARKLAELGTIPSPAFGTCMTAILAAKLGNSYGVSNAAQPILNEMLSKTSELRWTYYLSEVLPGDSVILSKMQFENSFQNWIGLVDKHRLFDVAIHNSKIKAFITACHNGQKSKAKRLANELLDGDID